MYIATIDEFLILWRLRKAFKKTVDTHVASKIFYSYYGYDIDNDSLDDIPITLHDSLRQLAEQNLLWFTWFTHEDSDKYYDLQLTYAGNRYFYDLFLILAKYSIMILTTGIATFLGIYITK